MTDQKRPLSLAHLTVLDLAPPQMLQVAAECGYDSVGLRLLAVTPTTPGYSLMTDPVMLRETKTVLANEDCRVLDIEFVRVTPDLQVGELESMFAVGAEVGAKHVITAPYDPDLNSLSQTLGAISELSQQYNISTVLEFFPWTNVPDLKTGLDVVQNAGDQVQLLVDSLHFNRSGSSLELLETVDAKRLPFMHLCDAPVFESYDQEQLLFAGREERLPPGVGDIPLGDIIRRMPDHAPLALEIPMTKMAAQEGSPAVARHVFDKAQAFLSEQGIAA